MLTSLKYTIYFIFHFLLSELNNFDHFWNFKSEHFLANFYDIREATNIVQPYFVLQMILILSMIKINQLYDLFWLLNKEFTRIGITINQFYKKSAKTSVLLMIQNLPRIKRNGHTIFMKEWKLIRNLKIGERLITLKKIHNIQILKVN